MKLGERAYTVFDIPPLGKEHLLDFESLPPDQYCGGDFRYRRFSQYRIHAKDNDWKMELLPHRHALQAKSINAAVGGLLRALEPLRVDLTTQIAASACAAQLDDNLSYQINVHQIRVVVRGTTEVNVVPEGPHRDGHELVMVAVVQRSNISGGVTTLMPLGGGDPFFETTLQANQALIFDDRKMWHYTTEIRSAAKDEPSYRDVLLVGINRWDRRLYGPEFEAAASSN